MKTKNLVQLNATPQQNQDELTSAVEVLSLKLEAIDKQKELAQNKAEQIKQNLKIFDSQIKDTLITSPLTGIVLNKFVNPGEMVVGGSVIALIGDISVLDAAIFLPINELSKVKIGQKVSLTVDGVKEKLLGKVTWISSEAEFTPKTILTKQVRSTLVYKVKIQVENKDQKLKIGLPLEVYLN